MAWPTVDKKNVPLTELIQESMSPEAKAEAEEQEARAQDPFTSTEVPVVPGDGCIGSTIKVVTGGYIDLLDPQPEHIDIETISGALSKICRFGGHCPRFYSVAEHSFHTARLAVYDYLPPPEIAAVLLHDAAEAYIGDVVKPLKKLLPEYGKIEARLEAVITERFNLPKYMGDRIKKYDKQVIKKEKLYFWPEDEHRWPGFDRVEASPHPIQEWVPEQADYYFLSLARSLGIFS